MHRVRRKVVQSGTDWLCNLWVRVFAYVEWLFDCCHSFLLLYEIIQPRRSTPTEEIM